MPCKILFIKIENFKSFRGVFRVEPLTAFNCLVGRNGSGKSNFFDAFAFSLGEHCENLRVSNYCQLINKSGKDSKITKASVTIAIRDEKDNDVVWNFKRCIHKNNTCDYQINDNVVSEAVFLRNLQNLKVHLQSSIIYQGTAQRIALMPPKSLTEFLEQFSGSIKYRTTYDQLNKQLDIQRNKLQFYVDQVKSLRRTVKMHRSSIQHMEATNLLNEEIETTKRTSVMLQSYSIANKLRNALEQLPLMTNRLFELEERREELRDSIDAKKRNRNEFYLNLSQIEESLNETERKSKLNSQITKFHQNVLDTEKRLLKTNNILAELRASEEKRKRDIEQFNNELEKMQSLLNKSLSESGDYDLDDTEMEEYYRLKNQALLKSIHLVQQLDLVKCSQQCETDRLSSLNENQTAKQLLLKRKSEERAALEIRLSRLGALKSSLEKEMQEGARKVQEFRTEIERVNRRAGEIQQRLNIVSSELGDYKQDKEIERINQCYEELKKCFPDGVMGKLLDLCEPKKRRHKIALTRVIQKYLDAIVVDTQETATKCIEYLKVKQLGRMIFLPAAHLRPYKLNTELRGVNGVKLVYDALHFDEKIVKVILFVVNNAIICERDEDARYHSFESQHKFNAVTLDGTFYRKSGLFSGGVVELSRKARKWDVQNLYKLKEEKEKLEQERDAARVAHKRFELSNIEIEQTGLEQRLKYLTIEETNIKRDIQKLDGDLAQLESDINRINNAMAVQEERINELNLQINEIQEQINKNEDEIFSNFCIKNGFSNIRKFEENQMFLDHQARKQKRLDIEIQIDRINCCLNYTENLKHQEKIHQYEETVRDLQKALKHFKEKEQEAKEALANLKTNENKLNCSTMELNTRIQNVTNEIRKLAQQRKQIVEEYKEQQTNLTLCEAEILKLKMERHSLLMQSYMEAIDIPILDGNLVDIAGMSERSQLTPTDEELSNAIYREEDKIRLDFDQIPHHLRRLKSDELENTINELQNKIQTLETALSSYEDIDRKAGKKFEKCNNQLKSLHNQISTTRIELRNNQNEFERVKQERFQLFNNCYQHLNRLVDDFYKTLLDCRNCSASLYLENQEEPYLGGVTYICTPPDKQYPLNNTTLSGGEQTMASMAFLLALNYYNTDSPFMVLDEADAALDSKAIGNFVRFLNQQSNSLQTILVSLKRDVSKQAVMLVGIYKSIDDSKIAMLDIQRFCMLYE